MQELEEPAVPIDSPHQTDWVASAAPALVVLGLLLVALVAYALRWALIGRFRDEEMEQRGVGGLTGACVRHFFAWLMGPVWRGLAALGVPPNAITTLAFGLAVSAGVAAALGRFGLSGWLFIGGGTLDFLDGRVARATGKATESGAALDSVLDRYSEAALLIGLCWYFRDSWVLLPALLALTGSSFVPYVRARGEALGAVMSDIGFMQRPERVLLLGLGVALSPIPEALFEAPSTRPAYDLAAGALSILAVASHATALQRLRHLVRALGSGAQRATRGFMARVAVIATVATLFDFASVFCLVDGGVGPVLATALGWAVGGASALALAHFLYPERLFFRADGVRAAALRIAFVSITSAGLNAGGVAILLLVPHLDYRIAWALTRVLVLVTWSVPLLRGFGQPAAATDATRRGLPRPPRTEPVTAIAPRLRRSDARGATL